MKEIIIRINLHYLKNETHVQFNETLDSVLQRYLNAVPAAMPIYTTLYKPALADEVSTLDFIRKSEITPQIAEQDNVRDSIFRGFTDTVKGLTKHFNPDYRVAATRVLDTIRHYGNISRKTLDDETAAVNDLLRELSSAYTSEINLLKLRDWTDKLRAENTRFTTLMSTRYDEAASKTTLRMRETRAATDKYYHAIMAQIEALSLLEPSVTDALIRELNAVIERYKNRLAQAAGRKKL